jgi:hypothetical protein
MKVLLAGDCIHETLRVDQGWLELHAHGQCQNQYPTRTLLVPYSYPRVP